MLVPILGYLILFNEALHQYFELSTNLVSDSVFATLLGETATNFRLYALYFAGCSLGLGQALFTFWCPSVVRAHGSSHAFVSAEGDSLLPEQLQDMAIQVVENELDLDALGPDINLVWQTDGYGSLPNRILQGRPVLLEISTTDAPEGEDAVALNHAKARVGELFPYDWTAPSVLVRWYGPQDTNRPVQRLTVAVLYISGALILAVVALDTFVSVLRTIAA